MSPLSSGDELHLGSRFVFRPRQAQLLDGGKRVAVGSRALALLGVLAESPGELVTKSHLIDRVWPETVVEENNLPVQIASLRKVLGPDAIATVPGRGYRLCLALMRASSTPGTKLVPGDQAPLDSLPPLVGREIDLARLLEFVEASGILTVTGPGGVGKTTLTRAVAARWCDTTQHPLAWADLAPLADAAGLVTTFAGAFGVDLPREADSIPDLVKLLPRLPILLVLDNAEHIALAVAQAVVALREAKKDLRVLVTSREPLQVPLERVYRLRGLAVPDPGASPAEAMRAAAVEVFVRCARLSDADLAAAIGDVTAICARLDGLPLAIEMAAARVPSLGVSGLRLRLEQHWRLLSSRARSVIPRHETLAATLDWSHELLDATEQRTLRRLSLFVSGFTLDAAREVAAEPGVDDWTVADALAGLIDKSMVVADANDPPRYKLLETVRAYAFDKLDAAGESGETRRRLLAWYLAFFGTAVESSWTFPAGAWTAEAVPELANLRSVLQSSLADPELYESAIELAAMTVPIWERLNQLGAAEARILGDAALARVTEQTPNEVLARLQFARGKHYGCIDAQSSLSAMQRALELGKNSLPARDLAHVMLEYGRVLARVGEFESAEQVLASADRTSRDANIPLLSALLHLSWALLRGLQGRSAEAGKHSEAAIAQCERAGAADLAAMARNDLADHLWAQGDLAGAEALLHRIVDESKRNPARGDHSGVPQMNLASVNAERGDHEAAVRWAREALVLLRRFDRLWSPYDGLSLIAVLRGQYDLAARLQGLSDALYIGAGLNVREPNEARIHAKVARALRERLDASQLRQEMARGAMLDADTACDLLLFPEKQGATLAPEAVSEKE